MAKIFISYSTVDRRFVQELANVLGAYGLAAWVDYRDIHAGDDIIARISDALSLATHVIVVLSRSSLQSLWVREELHASLLRAIEEGTTVIPVILGDVPQSQVPLFLRARRFITSEGGKLSEDNTKELLSALGIESGLNEVIAGGRINAHIDDIGVLLSRNPAITGLEVVFTNDSQGPLLITGVEIRCTRPETGLGIVTPEVVQYGIELSFSGTDSVLDIAGTVTRDPDGLLLHRVTGEFECSNIQRMLRLSIPTRTIIARHETAAMQLILTSARVQHIGAPVKQISSRNDSTNAFDVVDWDALPKLQRTRKLWMGSTSVVCYVGTGWRFGATIPDHTLLRWLRDRYIGGAWSDPDEDRPGEKWEA